MGVLRKGRKASAAAKGRIMRTRKMILPGMVVAGLGALAWAQSAPPIKMGLWENTSTVTMHLPTEAAANTNGSGGGTAMPPRTVTMKSCYTAAEWTKAFAANQAKNCAITNKVITAKSMSMDITCAGASQRNSVAHMDTVFDSPEETHSTMRMAMAGQHGSGMSMDVKTEGRYLGADCGDVKPFDLQNAGK